MKHLTVAQATRHFGLSGDTIRKRVMRGQIPDARKNWMGHWIITVSTSLSVTEYTWDEQPWFLMDPEYWRSVNGGDSREITGPEMETADESI